MSGRRSRVVAITGGNQGIGRAVAELFLERGDRVWVCSRSPRAKDLPRAVSHVRADASRRAELKRFVERAGNGRRGLDVLVNCAGLSLWRPLAKLDERFVSEMVGSNLLTTLWGSAEAAPRLKRGGAIVNVSSLAGKRGSANNSVYCATKFAVNGMTQALAKELGPRGIRVNAVCPVYVRTRQILRSLGEPSSPAGHQGVGPYLKSFAATQTALGRLPTEREVAEAVYFLAGPAASAITGQCINVDCGTLTQ